MAHPPSTTGGVSVSSVVVVWLGFWAVVVGVLAHEDYVRTHGGDPNQTMAWAESRFAAAGLELPAFQFAPSSDECGPDNLAVWDGTTIRNCTAGTRMRWTFLHELGHVWAQANLTADERARLVEEWGSETWNDPAIPHDLRGMEQFADMIAWALYPIRVDDCCTLTPEQMLRSLAELGITPLWR